ncbi:hypothetical protein PFHG_05366 [Plasmodium falciparum HB3]|uniref:DNAJ-containing protein X-domain domain-containing protein n=1 Tax=Plasmodium falciparum (isolate HB3) TaxID=137071 RepID=A0A0L7KL32_PLAFX|nr:hypothetical protein PFHG_05366 [Plasmodium falciparum HB3]
MKQHSSYRIGNSTCRLQFTHRCSRNLYGKELSIKPYLNSRYPIVISQVYGLPSEKPTFNLECIPDIHYTNIVGFNEKLMNDANRYTLLNNYEVIPHVKEFKPLIEIQEKAKKKIQNRFKKNKLKSSCAYNELRYTLREYFKTRKQVSSLSYTLENNNNKKYNQNKWYKNITNLDDKNKYKILYSFVKNLIKIALSDIEYTIKTVCENILTEKGIDDITIKARAESLNKLGYIIRQNILKGKNIKKIIKCDSRNIAANIVREINTINELLK